MPLKEKKMPKMVHVTEIIWTTSSSDS